MTDASQQFAERFASLSDDELIAMVTINAGDYVEEALRIARAELEKRGVKDIPEEKVQALQKEKTALKLGHWLWGYSFLMGLDAAIGISYVVRVAIAGSYVVALLRFILALLELATIVGLNTRRLWGWWLNWATLALVVVLVGISMAESMAGMIIGVVVVALVWGLPNSLYFKRRRHLFT